MNSRKLVKAINMIVSEIKTTANVQRAVSTCKGERRTCITSSYVNSLNIVSL